MCNYQGATQGGDHVPFGFNLCRYGAIGALCFK